MRILVTAAGGALAPLNIRLMKSGRRKIEVVAVDTRVDAVGRHFADVFSAVPPGNDPSYVDAVTDLVRRHRVDVVLPWSDEEALALASRRADVQAAGAMLACVDHEILKVMNSKTATLSRLQAHGIRTPRWQIAQDGDSLSRALQEMRAEFGEVAIKPVSSRGARDTYVIRKDIAGRVDYYGSREIHVDWTMFERDYRACLDAILPVMVMERLRAPAYDIDILAKDGRVIRAVPRERVNPAGIPFHGSHFRFSAGLLDLAEKVTKAFNLSWLYDYDLMTAADGEPVVIEINPRPSGSIAASITAGIPFYDDLFDLLAGEGVKPADLPADGQMVVPYLSCHISTANAGPTGKTG